MATLPGVWAGQVHHLNELHAFRIWEASLLWDSSSNALWTRFRLSERKALISNWETDSNNYSGALALPVFGEIQAASLPDYGIKKTVIFTHGIDRADPSPRCCPDGLRKNR